MPDDERIHDWPQINDTMVGLGFRLIDLHEHEMADDGGLHIQFGALDTLPEFADIALDSLTPRCQDDVEYFELTIEQYQRLYEASLEDGYRADHEGHKDEPKVAYLRALNTR